MESLGQESEAAVHSGVASYSGKPPFGSEGFPAEQMRPAQIPEDELLNLNSIFHEPSRAQAHNMSLGTKICGLCA